MKIALFILIHWYASLFLQTFFLHRYASHKMFTMSKGWERFFFILLYFVHGSSYLSPKVYGIMHRLHHAHTDTDSDPHSPKHSSNVFTLFLKTRTYYNDLLAGKIEVKEKYTRNLPEWEAMDKIGNSKLNRLMWIILYTLIYTQLVSAPWMYVFLPLTILMVAVQGAIINWFAHRVGTTNFSLKNTSTNIFRFDWLMMGEGYHNNHHKFPGKANFGYKRIELDITYLIIQLLFRLRIIQESERSQAQVTS